MIMASNNLMQEKAMAEEIATVIKIMGFVLDLLMEEAAIMQVIIIRDMEEVVVVVVVDLMDTRRNHIIPKLLIIKIKIQTVSLLRNMVKTLTKLTINKNMEERAVMEQTTSIMVLRIVMVIQCREILVGEGCRMMSQYSSM